MALLEIIVEVDPEALVLSDAEAAAAFILECDSSMRRTPVELVAAQWMKP